MPNQISDVYVGESFDEYLEHHGILGMHWGIRRTPEQLGHKVSKARQRFLENSEKAKAAGEAGKTKKFNKYVKKTERANKKVVKLQKSLDKALKKQVEEDDEIVRKGSVDEVLEISHRLSKEQMDNAINRIKKQNELKKLKPDEMSKVDRLITMGKKVSDIGETAYNITNNFNKFRGVMKDIAESEIKDYEARVEKERREKITKATRTGSVDAMKKVWGEADLKDLKNMSEVLKYRREIDKYEDPNYMMPKKKK